MMGKAFLLTARVAVLLMLGVAVAPEVRAIVTIDWVTVGGAGNLADSTGFGAVAIEYRISKSEVTNAQYAEFLNAVAATDTFALYNTLMAVGASLGGITRSGSSGSFTYSTIAGRENKPVNLVSFYDSLRFANWLHNGQGAGSTETGAYTITALGITNNSITREAGATVFLPSQDEWYKAAYYDVASTLYFDYPAGTDTQTGCTLPGASTNTANCNFAVGDLTDVGSYTGSASPIGTFDQGGNAWEWTEVIFSGGSFRVRRGGAANIQSSFFAAATFNISDPADEGIYAGFRVLSLVPPAPIPSLSRLGVALLLTALTVLTIRGWRRPRRSPS